MFVLLFGFLLNSEALQAAPADSADAADWPMWRYDAQHRAASPQALSHPLHLHWMRELPTPRAAWPKEQTKLQFDRSYEPVVMGAQVFVGSMVRDSLTAYDLASGRVRWRFFCDGPVRFAPVAWQGRVFAVSDDGCLYCLDADTGELLWRRVIAPTEQRVLGNGRVISAWPARGGPVIREGVLYCAAGIWPFMGIFVVAVDPLTGNVLWENSGAGSTYTRQQHSSDAFASIAPQGYLAATPEHLLIPGRTVPACLRRSDGSLQYFHLADRDQGKYAGGYNVGVWEDWFFNNGTVSRLRDGTPLAQIPFGVMGPDAYVTTDVNDRLTAYRFGEQERMAAKKKELTLRATIAWQLPGPALHRVHCQAGPTLYASNDSGLLVAVRIPQAGHVAQVCWQDQVPGKVWTIVAAQGRLLVVTEAGQLFCFGTEEKPALWYRNRSESAPPASRSMVDQARQLLEPLSDPNGYALWLGVGKGQLLSEVVRQSSLRILVLEPDVERVAALRGELERRGLYGTRVAILPGSLKTVALPPHSAHLVVVEDPAAVGLSGSHPGVTQLYQCLRPYGGLAWFALPKDQRLSFLGQLRAMSLPGKRIRDLAGGLGLQRHGALPGSSDWTHQYGNIANTVCSTDTLQLPLGLLWFGEESHCGEVLPRHGHGPPPQVSAGRLFIQGIRSLSARDVFTGRTLWTRVWPDLATDGIYYDDSYVPDYRDLSYNQQHIPGASVRGTNFVVTEDLVYMVHRGGCQVLDAATGEPMGQFTLPGQAGEAPSEWGFIGIYEDILIAGADFVPTPELPAKSDNKKMKDLLKWRSFLGKTSSQQLVIMNRYTGEVLWTMRARHGFVHNAIVAGNDLLYCIDSQAPSVLELRRLVKKKAQAGFRLCAVDIHTGTVQWEKQEGVFGSWLGYSQEHDVLLQAYRRSRDMLWEPGNRMAAHRGATGAQVWDRQIKYSGPCMLHHDVIVTQEAAYNLHTGEAVQRRHPLTGEAVPWTFERNYGCGTATASENLLMFRSAAAGYYDLSHDSGTGNWGGFRAGCSSNLVVADGVLSAPDYTSTCTCSYQNQTSLALRHMPGVEMWTFNDLKPGTEPVRNLGLNLGAPGDRRGDNGTLWLDYPSVGGPSPDPEVTVEPNQVTWFRQHATRLTAGELPWVEASGAAGLRRLRVRLVPARPTAQGSADDADGSPRFYTVRLHFMEPENLAPGQRVFDVGLQGQIVLPALDIRAQAGASRVGLVHEFTGIAVTDSLEISLQPRTQDKDTLLGGIEIRLDSAVESSRGVQATAAAMGP